MSKYAIYWLSRHDSGIEHQFLEFEAENDERAEAIAEEEWQKVLMTWRRDIYHTDRYNLFKIAKAYKGILE